MPGEVDAQKAIDRVQFDVPRLEVKPYFNVKYEVEKPSESDLRALVNATPHLASAASSTHDGRHLAFVLAIVRDKKGRTRRGIELRLLDKKGGRILDHTRTDEAGLALLRFPKAPHVAGDHPHANGNGNGPTLEPADDDTGFIDVVGSTPGDGAVAVPASPGFVIEHVELPSLPALPTTTDPVTGQETEILPIGDDLLSRLPSDFSPELCEAIADLVTTAPDSLFSRIPGIDPQDFRTKRYPLVKRLSIMAVGDPLQGGNGSVRTHVPKPLPTKRYLVRIRQEWKFLNYTLGELAGINNLDPGTVLRESTNTVQRSAEAMSHETQQVIATASKQVKSVLDRLQTVDHLVNQTTSQITESKNTAIPNPAFNPNITVSTGVNGTGGGEALAGAAVGGIIGGIVAGPLGVLAGGAIGGWLAGGGGESTTTVSGSVGNVPAMLNDGVKTTVTGLLNTTDNIDATLKVNQLVNTATEETNRMVKDAVETLRQLESLSGRVTDRVSPLLSRVTNLLRWTLYQNYLVCSHVEDVLEIKELRITEPASWSDEDLFSDEDVVEYRPFFEHALLRPQLRPHFDLLARQVDPRRSLVTRLAVRVDLDVPFLQSSWLPPFPPSTLAFLRVSANDGGTLTFPLRAGQRSVSGVLPIAPTLPGEQVDLRLSLDASPMAAYLSHTVGGESQPLNVEIRARQLVVGFGSDHPEATEPFGDSLVARLQQPQTSTTRTLSVPERAEERSLDPLTRHVNRNRSYYFGLLIQAALALPSLRDDAPQLEGFRSDHPLWRMPIIGVEGDRVFVLADADATDPDVIRITADAGAATRVQLAAPGTYSEALQGLLSLTDALGQIHPALEKPPVPQVPPLAIMDLTGRQLQVVDDVPVP